MVSTLHYIRLAFAMCSKSKKQVPTNKDHLDAQMDEIYHFALRGDAPVRLNRTVDWTYRGNAAVPTPTGVVPLFTLTKLTQVLVILAGQVTSSCEIPEFIDSSSKKLRSLLLVLMPKQTLVQAGAGQCTSGAPWCCTMVLHQSA